ncbi:MAG: hypothetical protein ACI8RZ_007031, partial [Myxococcota bacterium]
MSTAATLFTAWRDATASTLDHLLGLAVVLLLPVGILGLAGGTLLVDNGSGGGWLLIRLGLDLFIGPLTLLLGLHIAHERTFFSPTTAVGLLAAGGDRYWPAFKLYLPIALIIHPLMGLLGVPGIMLAYLGLGLTDPARWLEGGKLWGSPKQAGLLLLGATPLILAGSVGHLLFEFLVLCVFV